MYRAFLARFARGIHLLWVASRCRSAADSGGSAALTAEMHRALSEMFPESSPVPLVGLEARGWQDADWSEVLSHRVQTLRLELNGASRSVGDSLHRCLPQLHTLWYDGLMTGRSRSRSVRWLH